MRALGVLLRYGWRRHRIPLLPMIGVILAFEFVMTRMAPAPEDVNWMSALLSAVPPNLLQIAGGDIAFSTRGVLAIGYGHPFLLVLLSLWIVRVASGAIAGEIGRGTMDLLAVRPVWRWHLLAGGYLVLVAGVVALVAAAWTGTALGLATRPIGETARPFAAVSLMLALLFAAWGAIGMMVSVVRRDAGSAIAWTSGLIATSFVLDYLARLWKPMAAFRPFSLFAYYRPQALAISSISPPDAIALAAVVVLSLVVAVALLRRRDL